MYIGGGMEDEVCIWHRGIDIVEYVHSDGEAKYAVVSWHVV